MAEVSSTVQRVITATANSKHFRDYLWASLSLLPLGVSVLLKEQIARDSLTTVKSIL